MCKAGRQVFSAFICFTLLVQFLSTGVTNGYVLRVGGAVRPYTPSKRRLVVRVPFAQNPDNEQLSRIYKSMFTHSKQKKIAEYSLRSFLEDA
ncbi:hypothetical protein QR680_001584 [Steinernema hermaphroditum]|uniref:Uncharacterized protein n=1 Tax=Steinernema hermaphroditum TaxID=289476 RepID=A0AA39H0J5_9BILA|nr:hypothetical protein QR680_001584 [Steinernema hermaphroditum]